MSYHQYTPVPQRDTLSPSFEHKLNTASKSKEDRIIRLAVVIVVLCSVVDLFGVLYFVASPFVKQRNGNALSFDDLPYRSTYFKLDSLYSGKHRNATSREPVINLPRVIAHVDSSKPTSVLPLWPERWASDGGMVPYNERKVMVTPHISTVAEFHVMDFGMEKCSLTLKIPPMDGSSLDEGISLDAWLLSWSRPVDTDTLSWSSKPARQRHLGVFTAIANSTQQLPEYACNSGSYQIFELTCRTGDCNVEVAATMKQEIGLFLQQSQTI